MNVLTITVQVQIQPDTLSYLSYRTPAELEDMRMLRFSYVNNKNNSGGSINAPISLNELPHEVKRKIGEYLSEEKMRAEYEKRETK